ncbi:glycosyltransferase family 4 protein [Kitasatospora camelliae]|uniref:D-inositol 3-phosphate glycosyltransferase n=1 Tax=Kitasatospora camelliae TaxID=3156397 RepID=A0AAU8JQP4_9ACTN
MRIAIVAGRTGPAESRTTARLTALAAALTGLGHRVSVSTPLPRPGARPRRAVPGPVGPGGPGNPEDPLHATPVFGRALAEVWQDDPPDLVHAGGLDGGLAALAATRSLAGRPPLVLERVTELPAARRTAATSGAAARLRLLESLLAREGDLLLARSFAEAQLLRRLGAVSRRVAVVPPAVDTDLFLPRPFESPPGPPRLLSLDGGRSPEAVPLLTAALQRLPGVLITIAGGRAGGSRGQLRGLPEVPHDRVPELLAGTDLVVAVPSPASSGAAVLEAMACSVPVVAVDSPAVQDLVVDGVTGVVVPRGRPAALARAVRGLLGDPSLRLAMGIAGADRARARHSWPRVAGQLDRLYPTLHPAG